MSFKEYISQFKDLNDFSKEQKLVLITGKEFENLNYELKTNNNDYPFTDFKSKENKFSFNFKKGEEAFNLIIQNKKDGNFEICISNDKRSTSEEIKLDNYLKNNSQDFSSLESYIQSRIKDLEKDPLFHSERELRIPPHFNSQNNIIENNLNNVKEMPMENNLFRPNNDNYNNIGRNFANIGYDDLHGNLPNFVPGYNNYFGRPRGNLIGPDSFGFRGPGMGGINYDPITPFGPKFDFIPQYDGPMKKPDGGDLGMPGGRGFGFGNNFGGGNMGGGFNPFI
jgi:hypothetical protein